MRVAAGEGRTPELPVGLRDERVVFFARDGAILAGRWLTPDSPRSVTVVHCAHGIPSDDYAGFAAWLAAEHATAVLIYDYRDCGHSARGRIELAKATMSDWAVRDQSAAILAACERHPDLPIDIVGHALGAIGLPFHEFGDRVRRLVAVAAGPVHWSRHPPRYRPVVLGFWFLVGPIATALLHFLPGRLAGLPADLPAGAFWQWRRWCLARDFNASDWGVSMPEPDFDRFGGELHTVGIADDPLVPPSVARDVAIYYPRATQVTHATIDPKDLGGRKAGHNRIFGTSFRDLWPKIMPPVDPAGPLTATAST